MVIIIIIITVNIIILNFILIRLLNTLMVNWNLLGDP